MKKCKIIFLSVLFLFFCFAIYVLLSKPHSRHLGYPVASTILMDLRSFRSVILYYLSEHTSRDIQYGKNEFTLIHQYILEKFSDSSLIYRQIDLYVFSRTENGYWLGYDLNPYYRRVILGKDFGHFYGRDSLPLFARKKFMEKAKGVGLYGSDNINIFPVSLDVSCYYKSDDNAVWIYINDTDVEKFKLNLYETGR